ncbi:MAG TPA: exodeoxyribonuclease VII large subunit [Gemmatimonadales bacterium]|nr:exodeoxyribonuclease VII large subunit [Gemmatimonadales bacterium]
MISPQHADLIAPTDDVWSVSQLTTAAKRVVEGEFMPMWVRGEVVACKAWPSGHWYFSLRDAASQVRCCMWKRDALRAGKPPADGTEVFVLGRPGIYEAKGEFQLNVSRLIPTSAIGQAQQELERVKALLHRDGLFDVARKRPLPPYAAALAIVTSAAGAALHDIITVARRRWPCCRIVVIDARVQGDGAVEALARALRLVNRLADIDCCIVGRGGGGREDLAAFNAEAVCRALAEVRVPTISAVGHETDISLTDLVADVRAPTPSAAAELALADHRDVRRVLDDLAARLASGLAGRTRLGAERVEHAGDRLHGAMTALLERRRQQVVLLAAQLDALSPLRVLERGYAVPTGSEGRVLKRRADFLPGAPFRLRVADGSVDARVET